MNTIDVDYGDVFSGYKDWKRLETPTSYTVNGNRIWDRFDYTKYIDELSTYVRKRRRRPNPRKVNIADDVDITEII